MKMHAAPHTQSTSHCAQDSATALCRRAMGLGFQRLVYTRLERSLSVLPQRLCAKDVGAQDRHLLVSRMQRTADMLGAPWGARATCFKFFVTRTFSLAKKARPASCECFVKKKQNRLMLDKMRTIHINHINSSGSTRCRWCPMHPASPMDTTSLLMALGTASPDPTHQPLLPAPAGARPGFSRSPGSAECVS